MGDPENNIFEKVRVSEEKDRRPFEVQIILITLFLLASAIGCAILIRVYSTLPESTLCSYASNKYLFYGWPPNRTIIDGFHEYNIPSKDKCLYFLSLSSMSYILLSFAVIAVISRFWSSDHYYIRGTLLFFFVMLILGVVFAYTPISENYRRFGITTTVDVYGNIIRSGANIFAVYFSIYLLIFRLSAYIRAHK